MEHTSEVWVCKETTYGAQVRTTCLLPSFEPVYVYIAKVGDGFLVHDAGETFASILAHGQDVRDAKKSIRSECKRFGLDFGDRGISVKIDAPEWLDTAIASVANASSLSARNALKDDTKSSERELADVLFQLIQPSVGKAAISKGYVYSGASGRKYKFDLAIQSSNQLTLIETVTPHANSVNAKYVALADVPEEENLGKIVAHNNDLSQEDILLLQNVATVAGPNGVLKALQSQRHTVH